MWQVAGVISPQPPLWTVVLGRLGDSGRSIKGSVPQTTLLLEAQAQISVQEKKTRFYRKDISPVSSTIRSKER